MLAGEDDRTIRFQSNDARSKPACHGRPIDFSSISTRAGPSPPREQAHFEELLQFQLWPERPDSRQNKLPIETMHGKTCLNKIMAIRLTFLAFQINAQ